MNRRAFFTAGTAVGLGGLAPAQSSRCASRSRRLPRTAAVALS